MLWTKENMVNFNQTADLIKFYGHTTGSYREFSNFANYGFQENGVYWKTVEHYFQAMKFPGDSLYQEKIRFQTHAKDAKKLGQTRKIPIRSDWEQIKVKVMAHAVKAKFDNSQHLRYILDSTGESILVENAPNDYIWGCGKRGTGNNYLGKILMKLRTYYRENPSKPTR